MLFFRTFLNQRILKNALKHIRMITYGSREIKDWSNDAENPALCHRNKLHFKIY